MTRAYAWFVGVFLLLQGSSTLAFRLVPALDRAFPALLEQTRMVPAHSVLHLATAGLAFAALRWGGGRGGVLGPVFDGVFLFALGFGLFYTALAVSGFVTGSGLCLGLQPFDHPFHLLLGGLGLLAAGLDAVTARRRETTARSLR